jgi:hypothetical protein
VLAGRGVYDYGFGARQYKYYFKLGMAKGLYQFKASFAAVAGFGGSSTGIVNITLR